MNQTLREAEQKDKPDMDSWGHYLDSKILLCWNQTDILIIVYMSQ